MNFGEQFRKARTDMNLTQEQVAIELNISRQAVSHWENNKHLPDIERLINIARVCHLSLDQLILGDKADEITGSPMARKLIKDGSETRRARFNLIAICIGAVLMFMGTGCILIKAFSVEYVDANGILHENFFLLPIGFLFLFCGLLTFFITGLKTLADRIRNRKSLKDSDTSPDETL